LTLLILETLIKKLSFSHRQVLLTPILRFKGMNSVPQTISESLQQSKILKKKFKRIAQSPKMRQKPHSSCEKLCHKIPLTCYHISWTCKKYFPVAVDIFVIAILTHFKNFSKTPLHFPSFSFLVFFCDEYKREEIWA